VPNHPLLSRDCKQARNIKDAEALDVNWATLIVNTMIAVRIYFLNSSSFIELVRLNDIINTRFAAPCHKVCEHLLHFGQVEFSGTPKSENVMIIEVKFLEVSNSRCDYPLFKVSGDLVLFWACIAHKTRTDMFLRLSGPKWHFDKFSFR